MTSYYKAVETILKSLHYDRDKVFALADFLGFIRYHFGYIGKDKSRNLFMNEIARVFPDLSRNEHQEILKKFWIMHQKSFLDFFMAFRLDKTNYQNNFEYVGIENLEKALSKGRGAIISTFHYGDGRILHIGLALKGYPVSILSSKYEEYSSMGREVRLRTSKKFHKVFYEGESMRWMYRILEEKEIVFMSITGFPGNKGITVKCLGTDIYISTAPIRIAQKTKSPIVPAVAVREHGGKVKIFLEEPVEIEDSNDNSRVLEVNTLKLTGILEKFVYRFPDQHDWRVWLIRLSDTKKILNTRPI
jgi:Kdo2-lipid IVA lauroyltransferase/acyltransferase